MIYTKRMSIGTGLLALSLLTSFAVSLSARPVDFSQGVIVGASDDLPAKTLVMLQEEIEERTSVRLPISFAVPDERPTILVGTRRSFASGGVAIPPGIDLPSKSEGFAAWVDERRSPAPAVYLVGHDGRGALFAVGRLLRELTLAKGRIEIDSGFALSRAPRYPIRGHQIGYRHTANTYDAWSVEMYEQYIRDMILFGANSVEIIQEGGREHRDGPVLSETQWTMNVKLTRMIEDYGIDIWLWEPLLADVRDPDVAASELKRRQEFYAECDRIDHVMVPGGDPGHTDPAVLMPWLERHAAALHQEFPDAGLWVSHQKFKKDGLDYFFKYLHDMKPKWLRGIVYGPGTNMTLAETRRRTPRHYPIRRYPDITHNVRCQYPIPALDVIFAQTLGREGINPRPMATSHIHNVLAKHADGFVSYSDGAHDDLNKMVWSEMGWGAKGTAEEIDAILRDYGRVFFGASLAADVAEGLKMLEQNLAGPVLENDGIDAALRHWQQIERRGGDRLSANWRFQMYLFRAMFDAYVRARHVLEKGYEREAYAALSRARELGVSPAIAAAQWALAETDRTRPFLDDRIALEALGVKLLQLIGFQMSVDPPYLARNPERGALLDKLDRPLNDRLWLEDQFRKIVAIENEAEQLALIDRIVHWEDPGPGGFYDDLGNALKQPHLVRYQGADDPGFTLGPQEAHYRSLDNYSLQVSRLKMSWLDYAQTPSRIPLKMRYEGLDSDATYRLRVTYHGRFAPIMRLTVDESIEIHGALPMPQPVWPVEFEIPHRATRDGTLDLRWDLVDRRGCQVAEVWLLRQGPAG